jgi:predicted NBD/HSP70 family sugar kinase
MPLIEAEDAARRLARAIASDISLYNEEKVVGGIARDELFSVLRDAIEEGRKLYSSRVSPALASKNLFERAIVDIVVKSKGHIKSPVW